METLENLDDYSPPIWAIFGDLMSGLLGVFVLILIWTIGYQVELSQSLQEEIHKRKAEEQRRMALEKALAGPLAEGRVTLHDGRIGISGSVLFSLNSDQLQPDGSQLLKSLVAPLIVYLGERNEILMISGFTDNLSISSGNLKFDDNWDLSAQRALTVTRTLIKYGMPPTLVFAAAFGEHQPVVPNINEESRSRNRRVEIAPVPQGHDAQKADAQTVQSQVGQSQVVQAREHPK
jgi:flagellar motor protein MotB